MRQAPDRADPAGRLEAAAPLPAIDDALAPADEFAAVTARVLWRFVLLLGGLLLGSALVEALWSGPGGLVPMRAALGAAAVAGAAFGAWLERRGRPRTAGLATLLLLLAAAIAHAWTSGLGLHSLALAGASLLVALAGVLLTWRAALLMATLNTAAVLLLYLAHREGWLAPPDVVLRLEASARLTGQLLLIGAGLLAALTLSSPLRRSLQRALGQERRLGQLLRLGSDWAWELAPDGRLVMLTPSFEHHTGRTVAEFLRLNQPGGPSIVDDHDWRELRQALRGHQAFRELMCSYRCSDGSLLVIKASGEPMRDERGRFLGWWGVSRNVTAEMLAQRELERSRDMLDRLFRESPDAIFVAPVISGQLTMFNAAFMQLTGFSEAELLGRNGVELGLWRDPSQALALRDELLQQGRLRDKRSVVYNKAGERRQVLISAGRFEWDGEAVGVFSARDITEVERAWAEGEAILNNASVGVALVREHIFERINPAFVRMYGRPVGSLRGAPVATLFAKMRHFERFFAAADEALARGETVDVERHALRPDGSTLLVRLRGRAVDVTRPRDSGAIWIAEDISESRRVEQALAEARNQAEAASQAKSAFLASMSHEIRTPLNGVLGLARLLLDPALDERQRQDYLRLLAESAEGLSGIVSGVLDLTKIEAGRLQVERVPFDLAGLVDSAFGAFATLGRERGLAMHCEIDEALPLRVLGDPVRLRQILSNYLSNALKFTQRGTITLRVSAAAPPAVRLEVEDTGIGIAPDVRERLFQPFEQADGSTTRRFGGTGLGLSICRQLAELMGGAVGVDSDGASPHAAAIGPEGVGSRGPGAQPPLGGEALGARGAGPGSRFWVELPLPAADAPAAEAASAGAAPFAALDGLRVLVAEDNPVNMLIIVALLRRLGAQPLEAADGEQALALAREHAGTLDAVLMDLHMPVLDGLAAARALRDDPRTAALPVLALSAAVLEIERQQARQAGMCDFIAKPVDEAELLRALGRLRPMRVWPEAEADAAADGSRR